MRPEFKRASDWFIVACYTRVYWKYKPQPASTVQGVWK